MEVNNDTILNMVQTLGSIDSKIDAMEKHAKEFRELQEKNNDRIWEKLGDHEVIFKDHDERIRNNEIKDAKKTVILSAATTLAMSLIAAGVAAGVKALGS